MPRMPDWVANLSAQAPNLVEESPQTRKEEESTQVNNIGSAIDQAMAQMRERVRAAKEENLKATEAAVARVKAQREQDQQTHIAKQQELMAHQQNQIQQTQDAIARQKAQTLGTIEGQHDQIMQDTQQKDALGNDATEQLPAGFYPGEDTSTPEDPAQSVLQLSRNLGLNPSVVASMVLLGQEIDRLDKEGKIQRLPFPGDQVAAPQVPAPTPMPGPVPLAGPSVAGQPGTPPMTVPQPEPAPTQMAPPDLSGPPEQVS
jgi:hypothetical protein